MSHWEGVKGVIENHRTTGSRAWCLGDGEWCYEDILCRCCLQASEDYEICAVCEGEGYVKREDS